VLGSSRSLLLQQTLHHIKTIPIGNNLRNTPPQTPSTHIHLIHQEPTAPTIEATYPNHFPSSNPIFNVDDLLRVQPSFVVLCFKSAEACNQEFCVHI